ncbi:MAG: hypothetical protein KDD61_08725 [Bdellovibrionales bacterium]|nr:hypothetical protein [Bdellovibrionales bacterium]
MTDSYSLMSHYGIESEYMIVDKTSFKVNPIADVILTELNGGVLASEVECGPVSWSNELVNHVLEIKFSRPSPTVLNWDEEFNRSIRSMNQRLEKHNSVLLPTAMHPSMIPESETVLWKHGQKEIYNTYDRIFGCKGHGWSNLQSVHINLSFGSEAEFVKLHTAIRGVLPIIPFLAASSPFCEGRVGKSLDTRLEFYEKNQKKIPLIVGDVIPEQVDSFSDYNKIYESIYAAVKPFDPEGIIQEPWVNSRGAIPKFEYGAIEIRIMDIQESSYMDFCLIHFFTCLIRRLVLDSGALKLIMQTDSKYLKEIYLQSRAETPQPLPKDYLRIFNVDFISLGHKEFCLQLFDVCRSEIPERYHQGLRVILEQGSLSRRLLQSTTDISSTYRTLMDTLSRNAYYEPILD